MTPRQADKLIKAGKPVTLHNAFYDETMTDVVIVRRDRWNIYLADGAVMDRGDCEVIAPTQRRR